MIDLIARDIPYAIQKNHVRDVLNLFIKVTEEKLIAGDKVKIRNIGTLLVKERKAFTAILPNDTKPTRFKTGKSVKFIPSKSLNHKISRNF